MHPHIAPQTISDMSLADGTRVLLGWDDPNQYDDSITADISVGGLYTGEVHYWGADDDDATHYYTAAKYGTDSAQPGGLNSPQESHLNTNDLLEAVAFAAAGPAGWTPNPYVAGLFRSAADTAR